MDNISKEKFFFKVRKTAIEMLKDRNYLISQEDEFMPFSDFVNRFEENKINIVAPHDKNENRMAYVYFLLDTPTMSKKDLDRIKSFIDEEYPEKEMNVISIVQEKLTPQISKELLLDEFKNYEMFLAKQLMFNITRHRLVPKHILLNENEVKEVLNRFLATKTQMPRLLSSDPVARYYGMKSGDVCKIIRNSQMTGETYYYRLVK